MISTASKCVEESVPGCRDVWHPSGRSLNRAEYEAGEDRLGTVPPSPHPVQPKHPRALWAKGLGLDSG